MVIILNGHNLKETSVGFDEFLTLEALTIGFGGIGGFQTLGKFCIVSILNSVFDTGEPFYICTPITT